MGDSIICTFSDSQKIMAAEKPAVALALAAGCSRPAGCSIENRQRCWRSVVMHSSSGWGGS